MMNQSIITGLGTPQLSRIIEEGEDYSRRTEDPSYFLPTHRKPQQQSEQEEELTRIEQEIGEVGRQLQSLHLQMKRMLDKYSEEYLEKQGCRNTLRKRLIDLDFAHKTIFAKRHRRNNANSIVHQFYDQQAEQHPHPTPRSTEKLPAKDRNEATSERATKFVSPTKSYKDPKNQRSLQQSGRRAVGEKIEAQLEERVRTPNRVQLLTRELNQLRPAYSYASLGDYAPYLTDYYPYGTYLGWPY